MRFHKITGGGDTQLNVVESGNPQGRPILYIHGLSQCWLQWSRQLNSDLAQDHRLVAMDMRGHGLSEKPRAGYESSKLWADDVNAVIETLGLDGAVLCGWSYGPLVILDYIRHYGEDSIGGLQFVGSATKLGSEEALAVLTPEFLGLVPGFFQGLEQAILSKQIDPLGGALSNTSLRMVSSRRNGARLRRDILLQCSCLVPQRKSLGWPPRGAGEWGQVCHRFEDNAGDSRHRTEVRAPTFSFGDSA
jgi:pimeloyl-ACP methyl ester carboxylesterase